MRNLLFTQRSELNLVSFLLDVASQLKLTPIKPTQQQKSRKSARFVFGNYNRYYGYRSGERMETDPRVLALRPEWVHGKDVLDIGCNIGEYRVIGYTTKKIEVFP